MSVLFAFDTRTTEEWLGRRDDAKDAGDVSEISVAQALMPQLQLGQFSVVILCRANVFHNKFTRSGQIVIFRCCFVTVSSALTQINFCIIWLGLASGLIDAVFVVAVWGN